MAWEPDYVDVAVLAAWLGINDDEDDAKLDYTLTGDGFAVTRATGAVAAVPEHPR